MKKPWVSYWVSYWASLASPVLPATSTSSPKRPIPALYPSRRIPKRHSKLPVTTFEPCACCLCRRWAISDNRNAFSQALLSKGFVLARGDRRRFVAVDYQGEAYAIARYTDVKVKDVRQPLGDPQTLPSIEQANDKIAADMSKKLQQHLSHAEAIKQKFSAAFEFKRQCLV